MSQYLPIIVSLSLFTVVSIIFLIILNITLKIFLKRFNEKNLRIYGMFFNMRKKTIISFSLTTLTYLMLVWLLIDMKLNYIYIASILCMTIISNLIADDFPYGFLNILNIISCIASLAFLSFFNGLIVEDPTTTLYIIKWIIIVFLFMYFSYITLISLNHLLGVEKNIVINEKRGNNNEN